MWECKHCKVAFENFDKSQRANHSRWCNKNPKRNDWNKGTATVNTFGEYKQFLVKCSSCDEEFLVKEREKLHPKKDKYYCNRICANSVGGKAKAALYESTCYRVIAFRHHEKKCIVCSFDYIVAVHHIDEDHHNNDPKNLVALCPNHHEMFHSNSFRDEIKKHIDDYLKVRWGT